MPEFFTKEPFEYILKSLYGIQDRSHSCIFTNFSEVVRIADYLLLNSIEKDLIELLLESVTTENCLNVLNQFLEASSFKSGGDPKKKKMDDLSKAISSTVFFIGRRFFLLLKDHKETIMSFRKDIIWAILSSAAFHIHHSKELKIFVELLLDHFEINTPIALLNFVLLLCITELGS